MKQRVGGAAAFLLVLVAAASAGERPNAPENCPYCHGDPALMEASGIVSHGGFTFGVSDTGAVDELLAVADIRWVETSHFELGLALEPYRPTADERGALREELAALALDLPEVDPRTRSLDPWLRAHLYARRVERLWTRFLEIMRVDAAEFPDGETPWLLGSETYMGEGPYLGQKGKFELLVLPSEALQVSYLRQEFGLSIRKTQRWNVTDRDTLMVVLHTAQGALRVDTALYGHLAFNLGVNMLDGFKHYSYDTPIWLREGLAHVLEREVSPEHNSFGSAEGTLGLESRKSNWDSEVKKLIRRQEAPRLAELVGLKTFGEFTLERHFASWSMTRFLIEEHAEGYACLNGNLHGMKREDGSPDAGRMRDKHRRFFRECLGLSYAAFDEAWRSWALERESPARPR